MDSILSIFTNITVDGFALWVVLLICLGVFLAAFMDAIAGGGGIISVPTYLLAFSGVPTYYVLGTNKLSSCLGTCFSTARYIRQGYVDWKLFAPAVSLSILGSLAGTWLQHRTPEIILKYFLVIVLPVVALITLRGRSWPDEPGEMSRRKRIAIIWAAAALIGIYDGYYGPGTGTFLMIVFVRLAKLDVRHASGGTKILNLSSNIGGATAALANGYVFLGVGLCASAASILGHWLGAGLAIKNGSRIVRPAVIFVLVLLTLKVVSELLFPEFWH